VARRESGDKVVFGSADGPLCRKGAVVLRGGVLEREGDRAKKDSEFSGGFVVYCKEGKRVREGLEESDDGRKGRDVGGGGAGFERDEMDI
jgi:hypothetical protein